MSQYQNAAKFTYIFKFSAGMFVALCPKEKESHSAGTGGTLRNRLRLGIWCSNSVLSEIKPLINILQVHTAEPVIGRPCTTLLPAVFSEERGKHRMILHNTKHTQTF